MNFAIGLATAFLCLPIWYYLLYQILVKVNATELMFFLFWIYVPVTFLVTAIREALRKDL